MSVQITQTANTKTFIEQVNRLIESSKVKNYKEVADAIEWDKTAISNVMNGRRNIPHEKFSKFSEVYNIEKPSDTGYRDKYYSLLEQRINERDNLEAYLKEYAAKINTFEKSHKELTLSLKKLQHDLIVQSAITTAYQEWAIENVGGGNSRKVMNLIRKKAVALLTSFEQKGIGVDMGIVPDGH